MEEAPAAPPAARLPAKNFQKCLFLSILNIEHNISPKNKSSFIRFNHILLVHSFIQRTF
uniref:Uncharacterized protein n=1 Tax=Parascaris univalens TaxID=6257 RepID=A0A915A4J2_PARUN